MNYIFTFKCVLCSKEYGVEEDFEMDVCAIGLFTAKDELDDFLQKNWGWITKRTYRNEKMGSDRYWSVDLIKIVPDGKKK